MNSEELIEALRSMENKRVEQLDKNAQNVFYAIMKIADERDELKLKVHQLNEMNEQNYNKYCKELEKKNKAIETLYCWGETLNPEFQSKMLDILNS